MKKIGLCLLAACVALSSWASGLDATITSNPSPAKATQKLTVTISTDNDFGDEVYVYSWAVLVGSGSKEAAKWDGTNVDTYKMTGSSGVYSYTVDDIKSFYHLTDEELKQVEKLGFIAKTQGKQTVDCFVDVIREKYSGGDGTDSSPYILSTNADLKNLLLSVSDWDKCFRMDADISAEGVESPVGDSSTPFKGTFNGNGKSVKNLTLAGTKFGEGTGLFGTIDGANIYSECVDWRNR